MKKHILVLFLCGALFSAAASVEYQFRHYSVKDGLSQNTVMAILQDHKGFMWFGTWDGLNKFDGNEFTIYKSYPGDKSDISTNRIDFLYEDKNQFIWMQTYDGRYHRFDPRTETFQSLPNNTEIRRGKYCFLEATDKKIWIVTNDQGLISVASNPDNGEMDVTIFNQQNDASSLTNDTVHFVVQDQNETIWVGTNNGLNAIDSTNHATHYYPNQDKNKNTFLVAKPTENGIWLGSNDGILWRYSYADERFERIFLGKETQITDLAVIENRYIIATTQTEGFFVYDTNTLHIRNFSSFNTTAIRSNNFFTVSVDSYGVAWFEGQQSGILRYMPQTASLKRFQPKVDAVHKVSVQRNLILFEDANKRLWLNPQGGGFSYYDREADVLQPFFNEPNSKDCKFSNVIHTAFADQDNNLWISTYNKGVEKIVTIETQFQSIKVDKEQNTLTSNEVRAIQETSGGIVWIATKEGVTRCYDVLLQEIGILCENGTVKKNPNEKIFSKLLYTIHEDKQKRIWLGTKGDGIYLLSPKTGLPNLSFEIQHYQHDTNNPASLSDNNIYDITEDIQGNIWIGTYGGGLNRVEEKDGNITFLHSNNGLEFYPKEYGNKIRCLLSDKNNILWVGTTDGLFQIEKEDANYHIYHSRKTSGNPACLGDNNVHYLHQDNNGTIWMGTFGGGLNKLIKKATKDSPAEFKGYTTHSNGPYNDIVLCIIEDKFGNLWMTSENTISRFNATTDIFQNFNVLNGSSDAYFSEAAGLFLSSEKMLFGSNKGLFTFNPLKVLRSDDVPHIEFTRFQLFNKDCEIGAADSPLKKSIGFTSNITLTHNQSVFSIEYAALDMADPSRIQYAFILDGFEENWNYVQHQRKATYTNIPKGTYHFRVKSTNKDGIWVNNGTVLTIDIQPSFWQRPLAYILYIILLVVILFSFYYFSMKLSTKNMEVEIEKQVTDNKLKFFTNISHELRTPLSLILGPVEHILNKEKISADVREELLVVQSNTNRMMRLVNQILDFRKIQNKKMRLKLQPTLIDPFIRTICSNFEKEADDRHIAFKVESNLSQDTTLWIDQDKFDIILYNLLSNAFKFTQDYKKITVIIEEKEEVIALKVEDEGIGISKDRYNIVFNRFASTGETQKMGNFIIQSSGIGLHLVKELVELHHGVIEVESVEQEGTVFTITFQKGKQHFDPQEVDFIIGDDAGKVVKKEELKDIHLHNNLHIQTLTSKPQVSILIVEDNLDMKDFLLSIFKNNFNVLTAEDGKEGLACAFEHIPDIVITDLMMPEMDGLELTTALKTDERTNHIPVVLLTAKSAVENRLEALQIGADDYITKPFSPVYLEARIENLLEQRHKLQEHYRKDLLKLNPKKVEKEGISPEEAFLGKLMDFMERNMDNNNLSVEDLVSEMALGRTVFFNKLKGLTGLSPVEFIREIRIKRAAQLLEDDRYNVTEITYMVGMNDSRYFSKCFKTAYGITPSEYKKNLKTQREDNKEK